MRIFVTGATGLLGRALVPELLEHGHDVVGLARTDASRSLLRAMRASVYSGQGRNTERLAEAMGDMHVIVHLATTFPTSDAAIEDGWPQSPQILIGLLSNLLKASESCGVRTIVLGSFYGVYGNHGDEWVTEEASLAPDETSKAYLEAEELLMKSTAERKSAGVVLRMGLIYGPDALHTRGLLYGLKRGQAPIMSGGRMFWPMVHVDDAARALRLAVEQSAAGEVFNICDDEPVRQAQLYKDLAEWIDGPPPPRHGTSELRPYMGQIDPPPMRFSVRMRNRKAKKLLGFRPHFPTYREGYHAVLRDLARREAQEKQNE